MYNKDFCLKLENSIEKNKPSGVKGRYFKSLNISTTMGPNVNLEIGSLKI